MTTPRPLDRRQFITVTAAATAGLGFPNLIPARALGANGAVSPANRITIGCLGVGGMGNGNMNSFMNLPDTQVVAVCDVDAARLEKAKASVDRKYGTSDCKAYRDFREMIARAEIDVISLATPDHWHAIPAIAAARAGKDIYGEKPFSHDLREGRAMVNAIKQHGRVWQTGSWQRSVANFRFAVELVRNGRIGRIHTVEVGLPNGRPGGKQEFSDPPPELDYDFWIGPSPWAPYSPDRTHWNWRWQLDFGGGQMMDWIGHHGDIAHWGLGYDTTGPVEVEPVNSEWPKEGLWDAPVSYKFAAKYRTGVTLIVANASQQPKGMGARWIGDRGWVWVDRSGIDAEPKSLLKEVIGAEEINLLRSPGHHRNFIDCVKSRGQTLTPAEVAHRSASIGHLGQVAMTVGRKIRWNPEKEEVLNDATANALLGRSKREPWLM